MSPTGLCDTGTPWRTLALCQGNWLCTRPLPSLINDSRAWALPSSSHSGWASPKGKVTHCSQALLPTAEEQFEDVASASSSASALGGPVQKLSFRSTETAFPLYFLLYLFRSSDLYGIQLHLVITHKLFKSPIK